MIVTVQNKIIEEMVDALGIQVEFQAKNKIDAANRFCEVFRKKLSAMKDESVFTFCIDVDGTSFLAELCDVGHCVTYLN